MKRHQTFYDMLASHIMTLPSYEWRSILARTKRALEGKCNFPIEVRDWFGGQPLMSEWEQLRDAIERIRAEESRSKARRRISEQRRRQALSENIATRLPNLVVPEIKRALSYVEKQREYQREYKRRQREKGVTQ